MCFRTNFVAVGIIIKTPEQIEGNAAYKEMEAKLSEKSSGKKEEGGEAPAEGETPTEGETPAEGEEPEVTL